ncbi:hypothetical protein HELRODRAFT_173836 [Helobdella robusta]|uniref:Uncharacterized protein n=1 Tax=Helobdella robusta TaxID=6412 RepID=T1F7A7_HELRO|nr:hypothetical protein HELRODRAFT_173836 [Helobdella robusta]ESO02997.1 hypothetical protein HELRODRAFT_173836 [Helobdella robusta]
MVFFCYEDWKIKLEDECRVNTEMESFLRSCIRKCEDLLKSWKEKYGNDLAKKTLKLNELKTLRKDDMVKFNNLRHTYWEYEKVVAEDKHKKEMAKLEKERENEKLEAVLKTGMISFSLVTIVILLFFLLLTFLQLLILLTILFS